MSSKEDGNKGNAVIEPGIDDVWDTIEAGEDGRIFSTEDVLENISLIAPCPEKKYSVESSQQFSQYLNKDVSSRYRAIVLNAWNESFDSTHFEVGVVNIKNADHRNG